MKSAVWLLVLCSGFAHAEFETTGTRYISGYDFQNKYFSYFREAIEQKIDYQGYNELEKACFDNTAAFGFNVAAIGRPESTTPTLASVDVILRCLRVTFNELDRYLYNKDLMGRKRNLERLIDSVILEKYYTQQNISTWLTSSFVALAVEDQKLFVATSVENILGSDEVIKSFGHISDVDAYREHLLKKLTGKTIIGATQYIFEQLFLRDEFLTY